MKSVIWIIVAFCITISDEPLKAQYMRSAYSTLDKSCSSVRATQSADHEEGDSVAVCGVLHHRFEDSNLYDTQHPEWTKGCISIALPEGIRVNDDKFDGQEVIVFGRFKKNFCPEGDICQASCSQIGIYVDVVRRR